MPDLRRKIAFELGVNLMELSLAARPGSEAHAKARWNNADTSWEQVIESLKRQTRSLVRSLLLTLSQDMDRVCASNAGWDEFIEDLENKLDGESTMEGACFRLGFLSMAIGLGRGAMLSPQVMKGIHSRLEELCSAAAVPLAFFKEILDKAADFAVSDDDLLPVVLQAQRRIVLYLEIPHNGTVFLVHGHDDALKATAARFLERLGLEVTILHEKPNLGRTIIEKFEEFSDVGFAVVLLTADDVGRSTKVLAESPRARQNVIFELGFFMGKLGRGRVCALYMDTVELPSDYTGVSFVHIDRMGAWKLELARELRAAGLPVDMNNIV